MQSTTLDAIFGGGVAKGDGWQSPLREFRGPNGLRS
jgi:hypothetical protein